MTKSDAIRTALADGKVLDIDVLQARVEKELASVIGRKKLADLLSYLKSRGQIKIKGTGEDRTYALGSSPPPKGAGRKDSRPAKRRKAMKSTPRKTRIPVISIPPLIQRHIATTFAALESVLEVDACDPMVIAAFQSHKEAIELQQGAPA